MEYLLLLRIWRIMRKTVGVKRAGKNFLKHADLEWREQRTTGAHIFDPGKWIQDEEEEDWCATHKLGHC